MHKERIVVCMKWGSVYPASYVNVLYSAVCKNLTPPFRFVCLTNEPEGLTDGVKVLPIPNLDLPEDRYNHGAWPKLAVFQPDLYGLDGRCLFIDLDSVIVGSLNSFFEVPGDLIAIGAGKDWRRGQQNPNPSLGTGVFAFDLGMQPQIVNEFLKDKQAAYDSFANEQQLVEHYVTSWQTWPQAWVVSFKRHLRRPVILDRLLPPLPPPTDTKIVAFHGNPRPIDVVRPPKEGWATFPHYGRKPVQWVKDYWLENGVDFDR